MRGTRTYNTKKPALDPFDASLLDFAERWAPFGGGHEFIFAEFGIGLAEFYSRVKRVIEELGEPPDNRDRLTHVVRHNYALYTGER